MVQDRRQVQAIKRDIEQLRREARYPRVPVSQVICYSITFDFLFLVYVKIKLL